MAYGKKIANPSAPASDSQVLWIEKCLASKILDTFSAHEEIVVLIAGNPDDWKQLITKGKAGKYLDELFALPKKITPKTTAPDATAQDAKAAFAELEADALYAFDGKIYKVVTAKTSTKKYAKVLELPTGSKKKGYWAYAPSAIATLTPAMKLTAAKAAEYGQATGVCCVCATELTDPKSIAAGIGPVCAKKV